MPQELKNLVRAARQGDDDACTRLYHLTFVKALGRARSLVRSEQDALDVVQDSYIQAFRSLDSLEKPESFPSWLNQIVTNRCRNLMSRSKALRYEVSLTGGEGEERDWEDENPRFRPDASLDDLETKRLLKEIVDSLPQEQRSCVLLHYFQDLKLSEIARILGVPENTVKSRLHYAKAKIKQGVRELERRGTKLYAAQAIPALRWAMEESTRRLAAENAAALLSNIAGVLGWAAAGTAAGAAAGTASSAGAAGGTAGAAGGTAAGGSLLTAAGAKVAAGVLAAVVAVGGAVSYRRASAPGSQAQAVPAAGILREEIPETPLSCDAYEAVRLFNAARYRQGLDCLARSGILMDVAQQCAEEDTGAAGDADALSLLEAAGCNYSTVKSCSLPGFRTEEEMIAAAEPGFLLAEDCQEIGIGCCVRDGAADWYILLAAPEAPKPEPISEPVAELSGEAADFIGQLNDFREENGLDALTPSRVLMGMADENVRLNAYDPVENQDFLLEQPTPAGRLGREYGYSPSEYKCIGYVLPEKYVPAFDSEAYLDGEFAWIGVSCFEARGHCFWTVLLVK